VDRHDDFLVGHHSHDDTRVLAFRSVVIPTTTIFDTEWTSGLDPAPTWDSWWDDSDPTRGTSQKPKTYC